MEPQPQLSPRRVQTQADAWELVRSAAPETPLERARGLEAGEVEILLKREDLGPNGSFKWRGALCAVADLADAGADRIVTASTGNHGAATSWAARRIGVAAHVVVPADAGGIKCSLIEGNGAALHRVGEDLQAAVEHARLLAAELDAPYFEDGASRAQLLGAGTIGRELAEADPAAVIVPLAVGALAGGLATGLRAESGGAELYGVQADGFDAIARRLRGSVVDSPAGRHTFADGLADDRIVEPAFSACRRNLTDIVVASEYALEQAVIELHSAEGIVAEGAGAAALAGLREIGIDCWKGRSVVLLISGRNLDREVAGRLLAGHSAASG